MDENNKKNHIIIHIVLILFAGMMLFPFLWMILTSLKTYIETVHVPAIIFPADPQWSNYVEIFDLMPFARMYLNSIYVTTMIVIGQVFISAMAAYAFARLDFPFKNAIFFIVLSVMMIPAQVFLLPQFIAMKELGLVNTLTALFLPNLFSAYAVFLLRQFFMSLPIEIEEAAIIDGCGRFKIFTAICLPLAKSGLIAMGIFAFLYGWNDLQWPIIVNSIPEKLTLAPGISGLQGQFFVDESLLMAAATMSCIPPIVLFIKFQKQFVEGIAISGIKG